MTLASDDLSALQESVSTYFQQVLGVRSVLICGETATDKNSVKNSMKKSVLFLLPQVLSSRAQSLLEKMIAAMKLDLGSYDIIQKDLSPDFDCYSQVIEFVDSLQPNLEFNQKPAPHTLTWSPEILLQKPGLKKQVWAHLQQVMKNLS
jgi:hypothetical protein